MHPNNIYRGGLQPLLRPILQPLLRSPLEAGVGRGRINLLSTSDQHPTLNANSTPTPLYGTQAAPDGSLTGWSFAPETTGLVQKNLPVPADFRPYVYSIRVKALGASARVYMPAFGISSVVGQVNGVSDAYYDFDSDTFGNGMLDWYSNPEDNGYVRLHRLFVNNGVGTTLVMRTDSDVTYTNGIVAFAWHQLEVGNAPTAYQRNDAAAPAIQSSYPFARSHAAWGDSLTAGSGDDPYLGGQNGYSRRLNGERKMNHYNGGVAGETSTQIRDRVIADAQGRNSWVNLFWMGNNNPSAGETIKADVAACVTNLHEGNGRYLVLGLLLNATSDAATATAVESINTDLSAIYGSRYVDVRAYLQSKGDGSAEDNADIAAGHVPRSLRVDSIHLNAAGYQHVADCVAARLTALGY